MPPSQTSSTDYNPANPTPYSAPQLPEVTPPPPPIQTSQPPGTFQPGPQLSPKSKGAAVAYLASGLLKGFAQGRTQAEIVKTARMKRTLDGLQFAYNNAAEKYADMKRRGVGGAELDQAKAAVDASWAAMMQFYGKYFDQGGQPKGKKKKSQSSSTSSVGGGPSSIDLGGGGQIPNPVAGLMSQDPQEKAQTFYNLAKRVGPPVYYQTSQYDTPEYKQQMELNRKQAQAELDVENKRLRLHELEKRSDLDQPGHEKEKAELESLQSDPELFPQLSRETPHYATFDTPGSSIPPGTVDAMGNPIDPKQTYRRLERGGVVSWVPSIQKLGKPTIGWAKDAKGKLYSVEIDPATNQPKKGTENYDRIPPPGMLEHVRTGEFSWTDADGKLHRSQTTTTTSPVLPGAGAGAGAGGATGGTKEGGVTPKGEVSGGGGVGKQPTVLKAGETGPLGVKASPGDRIIGDVGAKGQAKSRAEAAETVLTILPQALTLLKDPVVQANLGVLNGRWSEIEKKIGNLDPKVQEFYGLLKSIYAANGAMHGWRSLKAPEEFQKAYGDLHTEPATLVGGLKAVTDSAKAFYETGFHHPYAPKGQASLGTPSAPSSIPTSGGAPQTADEYLKTIGASH
jgi:hypothetical protein